MFSEELQSDQDKLADILGSSPIYVIKRSERSTPSGPQNLYDFFYLDSDLNLISCTFLLSVLTGDLRDRKGRIAIDSYESPRGIVAKAASVVDVEDFRVQEL